MNNKASLPAKQKYHRVTFTYNGKRYERKGKTLPEAHEKAAELKAALKRGDIGVSSNMPVKAWAMEWLEVYKRPTIGAGQYHNYLRHIENVVIPAIGNKAIKDVKDIDLQKIMNSRTGNSKSDLSKLRNSLKSMFRRAQATGLIMRNPAEFLEVPTSTDGTRRSITDEERKAILELAETHYAGLWIKTMLYCGARPAETRALDWRHIDFSKKVIHIEQATAAYTGEIKKPKTDAGIRNIPVPDILVGDLQRAYTSPFEPVFVQSTTGKRHTKSSMQCLWNNFKRELDICMGAKVYRNKIIVSAVAADLVPYCLRHTYCTDLQDAGVPINIAKYLMGHTNISMTATVYTHTTEKAIQDAADKINNHA